MMVTFIDIFDTESKANEKNSKRWFIETMITDGDRQQHAPSIVTYKIQQINGTTHCNWYRVVNSSAYIIEKKKVEINGNAAKK